MTVLMKNLLELLGLTLLILKPASCKSYNPKTHSPLAARSSDVHTVAELFLLTTNLTYNEK